MKQKRSAKSPNRTLGPLPDLERHLPEEWWRTLFNAVYISTDGDVFENIENTRHEVDALERVLGLEMQHKILDICCGQGRHLIELAHRGYKNLTGLDRSNYLVRLARKRAKKSNLSIQFKEGDARRFALPENNFDRVYMMGNSFGYFDREEDDLAVLSAILRTLKSNALVAIDLTDGDWMRNHFEPRSWEWIDENQFVCRERALTADGDRLISREVVTHAEHGVIADQFYAERLYNKDRIKALFEEAGFRDVTFHDDTLEGISTRDEDLGMMAHRIFLTAVGPEKAADNKEVPILDVSVLMGDPRLPDTVKLGGQFNPEDMATINRLKEALASLKGYRFSYIDDHAAMQSLIKKANPDFVFNLCDEGYNNKATLEMHVPAYLEMLDIPYSGGSPQALAVCYNKAIVRAVAMSCDIPVPLETFYSPEDHGITIPSFLPALIKPCEGDSSIGITSKAVVHNASDAMAYINSLKELLPDTPILVQEFLTGSEYSVGLIGNPEVGMRALPILEVDYSKLDSTLPKILGYESKWDPNSPYWSDIAYKPAELDEETSRNLVNWSTTLFGRLGCRDYARVDFRADADGTIKLLEMNPNPGWCWDGKLNLMAGFAGMSYADLLEQILQSAQKRIFSHAN